MEFTSAQKLNRHKRRQLEKANAVKIPGTVKPFVKPKRFIRYK